MDANNDPFDIRIASCLFQVLFEVIILRAAQVVRMLRGEVKDVNLCIIEGEPKIGGSVRISRKDVSSHIRSIVVESFMVAYARHEGSESCKFLSQLAEQVPYRLQLSCFFVADSRISYISSKEDEVIRTNQVILCDLIDHKRTKRSIGAHISKHSDVDFLQSLYFQRRRPEIFHF